jgi:hypothetical protein
MLEERLCQLGKNVRGNLITPASADYERAFGMGRQGTERTFVDASLSH